MIKPCLPKLWTILQRFLSNNTRLSSHFIKLIDLIGLDLFIDLFIIRLLILYYILSRYAELRANKINCQFRSIDNFITKRQSNTYKQHEFTHGNRSVYIFSSFQSIVESRAASRNRQIEEKNNHFIKKQEVVELVVDFGLRIDKKSTKKSLVFRGQKVQVSSMDA